ncbi:LpqB family beta-propeller domain-containing protein [Plantibacter sp. ME-Dv--P-095]|uniref:LpqB family beta-propeller domain-containing protein n=1 Tax=Plantibacter sp. ME-Dv--P-095 TaxID=3040299 RepID=UPI00254D4F4E|nr:LpqB family beta-propeller domain-containing protein [Plantibacter sp. ME-Dv--P-095]
MPDRSARPGRRRSVARRFAAAALPVLLVVVLSACVGIPRGGSVQDGGTVGGSDGDVDVNFIAPGPTEGATQEQILRGFVDAAASPQNNYEIAREFLAPELRSDWDPDAGVTIDQGGRTFAPVADAVQLTVSPVAAVDDRGEYRESANSSPLSWTYGFIQVRGEWRIASAPPGIVLEASTFADVFAAYSLSYFDPSYSRLVPDQRWFPSRASTATRIVGALLDGPAEWLKGAVATAFPEGTSLTSDAVPVEAGTARVDLTKPALQADAVTLQRMQLQLTSSLVQLSGSVGGVAAVSNVAITVVGNSTQTVSPLTLTAPRVDPRALVQRGDEFGFASGDGIETVPGISTAVVAAGADAAVLSADHDQAAVRSAAGVTVVQADGDVRLVDDRPGLLPPTMDPFGFTWTVPASAPTALLAHDAAGGTVQVTTSWTGASTIDSIQISREGTRLVALLRDGTQSRLVAAAIIRGDRNAPLRLGDPVELRVMSSEAKTVTWVDDITVAVLLDGDGQTTILTQQIGGRSAPVPPLANVTTLVGGNGLTQLRALTSDGRLLLPRGSSWQEAGGDVRFIATQLGSPD